MGAQGTCTFELECRAANSNVAGLICDRIRVCCRQPLPGVSKPPFPEGQRIAGVQDLVCGARVGCSSFIGTRVAGIVGAPASI